VLLWDSGAWRWILIVLGLIALVDIAVLIRRLRG